MDTIMEGPERAKDKTAIQRSEGGGMLILPWTKQILSVIWEHLRLLLHVVYYSFLAVFHMFRLEVHLRITDETGHPRVEHVSASGSPAESFFLSSLFDGNSGVFVPGSSSLSKQGVNAYAGGSHAGALLSSFGAEDLCLSLVDDFVIRAQERFSEDTDTDLCLGHHPVWKQRGPTDWEARVSEECQREEEACCSSADAETVEVVEVVPDLRAAVENDDSFWDEEDEDAGEEFDEGQSRALWDSFSKSCDPYNPLSFSACISSSSENASEGWDRGFSSSSAEEGSSPQPFREHQLDWVRPGSESEGDWDSSDSSEEEDGVEQENERLWELFANPPDPYNPLHFTACAASSSSSSSSKGGGPEGGLTDLLIRAGLPEEHNTALLSSDSALLSSDSALLPSDSALLPSDSALLSSDSAESDRPSCSEEEEEEELWNSFSQNADPYHPLHFRACLQSSPTRRDRPGSPPQSKTPGPGTPRRSKPRLPKRQIKRHCCVRTWQDPHTLSPHTLSPHTLSPHTLSRHTLSPWRKPGRGPPTDLQTDHKHSPKKVRFSPLVQVHVIRAWSFAMRAVRRGPWEEMGRDRARFHRRIQETEHAIGYCLHQSHREKMLEYLLQRQNMPAVLGL